MSENLDSMIEWVLGVLRAAAHEGEFAFFSRRISESEEEDEKREKETPKATVRRVRRVRNARVMLCWCSGRIARHLKAGFDSLHVTM